MTKRILILAVFLAFSSIGAHAQNCSTGSYNYGDYQGASQPCPFQSGFITVTDTQTASERCTATYGVSSMPPGTQDWTASPPSTDIGYGQRQCPTAVLDIAEEIAPKLYGKTLAMIEAEGWDLRDGTVLRELISKATIIRFICMGRDPRKWMDSIPDFDRLFELAVQ